jgi:hypothetical protein
MKQTVIHSYGESFIVKSFFDIDTQTSGLDVCKKTGEHIGEIWGIEIPDEEDEKGTFEEFEKAVGDWLEENFW